MQEGCEVWPLDQNKLCVIERSGNDGDIMLTTHLA